MRHRFGGFTCCIIILWRSSFRHGLLRLIFSQRRWRPFRSFLRNSWTALANTSLGRGSRDLPLLTLLRGSPLDVAKLWLFPGFFGVVPTVVVVEPMSINQWVLDAAPDFEVVEEDDVEMPVPLRFLLSGNLRIDHPSFLAFASISRQSIGPFTEIVICKVKSTIS